MTSQEFKAKATALIDDLKGVCANYGLGNDGNEFKIITQVFLYKFMNDKFAYEAKTIEQFNLANANNFQEALEALDEEQYNFLLAFINANTPQLYPHQTITYLHNKQNSNDFAKLF